MLAATVLLFTAAGKELFDTHQNHQLPPKGDNCSAYHTRIMLGRRPLPDKNTPDIISLCIHCSCKHQYIKRLVGSVRLKELMPWLCRHWEVYNLFCFTFCSPKIHYFCFWYITLHERRLGEQYILKHWCTILSQWKSGRQDTWSWANPPQYKIPEEIFGLVQLCEGLTHGKFSGSSAKFSLDVVRDKQCTLSTFPSWAAGTHCGVKASWSLLQSKQPNERAFQFCSNHHY